MEDRPLTMELRTEINRLAKLAIRSGIGEVVRRKCLRLIDEIEDEQEKVNVQWDMYKHAYDDDRPYIAANISDLLKRMKIK